MALIANSVIIFFLPSNSLFQATCMLLFIEAFLLPLKIMKLSGCLLLALRSLINQIHKLVKFRSDDDLGTTVTLTTQLRII